MGYFAGTVGHSESGARRHVASDKNEARTIDLNLTAGSKTNEMHFLSGLGQRQCFILRLLLMETAACEEKQESDPTAFRNGKLRGRHDSRTATATTNE